MTLCFLDPRRRLAAAVGWALVLVSLAIAAITGQWTAARTQAALEEEIGQLYVSHAKRLIDTMDADLAGRRLWIAASATLIGAPGGPLNSDDATHALNNLRHAFPEIAWAGVISIDGTVMVGTDNLLVGESVATRPWFTGAFLGPYLGDAQRERLLDPFLPPIDGGEPRHFIDLSAPILDHRGNIRGVLAVALGKPWIDSLQQATLATLRDRPKVEVLLLGIDGTVLYGSPQTPRGTRVNLSRFRVNGPQFSEDNGQLTGLVPSSGFADFPGLKWWVIVREPVSSAFRTARETAFVVFATIAGSGIAVAIVGAFLASRIMRRVTRLADAADALRIGRASDFRAISGRDEAARISRSLASLIDTLQAANADLITINLELDARVAERTAEIERLSAEARSSAIVKERLRISRDLHDTVAHTLLGLITQLRLIRKTAEVAPERLTEELDHAENAAREGLAYARDAVARLRQSPVRDEGLAVALQMLIDKLQARSEARLSLTATDTIGPSADEVLEVIYRMTEESLRNAIHHADALSIAVDLNARHGDSGFLITVMVRDDGIGFDPQTEYPGHFGLLGLYEQAQLIGADVAIASRPGGGTTLTVTLGP